MNDTLTSITDSTVALNTTERIVADLWNEVLQISEPLTASDDFFALGGDSVAMVTVLFRIKEEFFVELPPESMLNAPTLGELSAAVDSTSLRHRASLDGAGENAVP